MFNFKKAIAKTIVLQPKFLKWALIIGLLIFSINFFFVGAYFKYNLPIDADELKYTFIDNSHLREGSDESNLASLLFGDSRTYDWGAYIDLLREGATSINNLNSKEDMVKVLEDRIVRRKSDILENSLISFIGALLFSMLIFNLIYATKSVFVWAKKNAE